MRMTHESVMRAGKIVDGTGAEPFFGDIAIDGETIVEIGKVKGKGHEEIDANGEAVTPGFVDLHTHFDAQVAWDPMLTPVSWHGVTTVLMGNCGVTFAPCRPKDRTFLAEMMETVEDIPREAILTGLSWKWESYGEYLDAIDALHHALARSHVQLLARLTHHSARDHTFVSLNDIRLIPTREAGAGMNDRLKQIAPRTNLANRGKVRPKQPALFLDTMTRRAGGFFGNEDH